MLNSYCEFRFTGKRAMNILPLVATKASMIMWVLITHSHTVT